MTAATAGGCDGSNSGEGRDAMSETAITGAMAGKQWSFFAVVMGGATAVMAATAGRTGTAATAGKAGTAAAVTTTETAAMAARASNGGFLW